MSLDLAGALDLVVERLVAAGVNAATTPEAVNVPGCYVDLGQPVAFYPTLAGMRIGVEVTAIVPANDKATALAALQVLLDVIVGELGIPDGDVRKQATVLPDSPVGLPSLVLPYIVT